MSKHTELPWKFTWGEQDTRGWCSGRLIAESISNGQYNKTILAVDHYPHNDGIANAEYIVKACNNYPKLEQENEALQSNIAKLKYDNEQLKEDRAKLAQFIKNANAGDYEMWCKRAAEYLKELGEL